MIKDFSVSMICKDCTSTICWLYQKNYFLFIDYDLNIFWRRQLYEILTSLAPCQLQINYDIILS